MTSDLFVATNHCEQPTHIVITDKSTQKAPQTPALIGNMPRMLKVTLTQAVLVWLRRLHMRIDPS